MEPPVLRKVDAVTVPVPDLDSGPEFYVGQLRHRLLWRNDDVGQAALGLPDSDSEIVLTTGQRYEPNWRVDAVDEAVMVFQGAGGRLVAPAFDIPVGRVAVVADPFDNVLMSIDLSKGHYRTANDCKVAGVVDRGR